MLLSWKLKRMVGQKNIPRFWQKTGGGVAKQSPLMDIEVAADKHN